MKIQLNDSLMLQNGIHIKYVFKFGKFLQKQYTVKILLIQQVFNILKINQQEYSLLTDVWMIQDRFVEQKLLNLIKQKTILNS